MKPFDVVLAISTVVLVALAAPTAFQIATLAYETRQPPEALGEVPRFTALVADAPRIGPQGAALEAVVFFDYACAACRRGAEALDALLDEYSTEVSLTFRHFPLISDHSVLAARAAECADQRGAFQPIHQLLLSAEFPPASFATAIPELFREAGFETRGDWMACVEGLESGIAVSDDLASAMALGISATPTFLLNGEVFEGGIAAFGRLLRQRAK
jgi:protein-disulfide isomerase